MKINSSGQAMIEAAIGLSVLTCVLSSIFAVLFIGWTHFLVDSASDTLAVCTLEKRQAPACMRESKRWLETAAPWLRIISINSYWTTTVSGHLRSESTIQTRLIPEGPWPEKYTARRQFCEKMKKGLSSRALCS